MFLVDVVQLNVGHEDWNQLGRQIFNNMEILKLGTFRFFNLCDPPLHLSFFYHLNTKKKGFSPTNDLAMFQKLIPGLSLSSLSLTSYLDLQELWHKLTHSMSKFKFPYEGMIGIRTRRYFIHWN